MSETQERTTPLEWSEFLLLISIIDDKVSKTLHVVKHDQLIKHQTLIAISGYSGLVAKQILNMTWSEALKMNKSKSNQIIWPTALEELVERNFHLLTGVSSTDLILHKKQDSKATVKVQQYNQYIKRIIKNVPLSCEQFSSLTLVKTFGLYQYNTLGLKEATRLLGLRHINKTLEFLNISTIDHE